MGDYKRVRVFKNVIFFLNVFIAVMIIGGSWLLAKTEFGRSAMAFGFIMLAISTVLKIVQKW